MLSRKKKSIIRPFRISRRETADYWQLKNMSIFELFVLLTHAYFNLVCFSAVDPAYRSRTKSSPRFSNSGNGSKSNTAEQVCTCAFKVCRLKSVASLCMLHDQWCMLFCGASRLGVQAVDRNIFPSLKCTEVYSFKES